MLSPTIRSDLGDIILLYWRYTYGRNHGLRRSGSFFSCAVWWQVFQLCGIVAGSSAVLQIKKHNSRPCKIRLHINAPDIGLVSAFSPENIGYCTSLLGEYPCQKLLKNHLTGNVVNGIYMQGTALYVTGHDLARWLARPCVDWTQNCVLLTSRTRGEKANRRKRTQKLWLREK